MRIELGIPLSLNEISTAIGSSADLNKAAQITHISTDSREVYKGDLFIALRGEKYNGASFADEARKSGAYILSSVKKASDIFTPDTRQALLDLAAYYKQKLPYLLYKIGITGSVGKTTTREFLKILLSQKYITHASEGNFNNEIGLPLSILSAKQDTQILLMELGMNSRGEISRLSKCLNPDVAVITNIGSAHIGRLGSREEIAAAKLEILEGMCDGKIIVPMDEVLLADVEEGFTFSTTNSAADLLISKSRNDELNVYCKGSHFCSSKFALSEEHHTKCLAAAASVAIVLSVSPNELSGGISYISLDNIRQKEIFAENYHFYDDCYNASRESMIASIYAFSSKALSGKKNLLLGDILELGDHRSQVHFEVGKTIDQNKISRLFLFGEHAEEIGVGAKSNGFPDDRIYLNSDINNPAITAEAIRRWCIAGEHILIKGSRGIRLERVLHCFIENDEGSKKNE